MNILVVGGTRFFGIPMIKALLSAGHDVTIATRGNQPNPFPKETKHVLLDRKVSASVRAALPQQKYDCIIDKVAYSSNDVRALLENVICERYILMSSASVYEDTHADIKETEFEPSLHNLVWADSFDDYTEAKRQAERAALEFVDYDRCSFVRYPVVLGKRDYTNRVGFYADHIKDEYPMYIDDYEWGMSFINESDAGGFMAYLIDHFVCGAINGSSNGIVSIETLIKRLEEKYRKKAVVDPDGDAAPFNGLKADFSLNTEKATAAGYNFLDINRWFFDIL